MIILTVGMPRAGSGWHYNLTKALMATTGAADAQDIRQRFRLQSILTEVNCNIGVLSPRRMAMVMIPSLLGSTFVIKAHSGPTTVASQLIRLGQLKVTYIYRDPRDALLSAYEYGRRAVEKGHPNAFSHLDSIEKAIEFMQEYVDDWSDWISCERCHHVRYEDLKTNYLAETTRLAKFLGLDSSAPDVAQAIQQFQPEKAKTEQQGVHFFKGVSGRFREGLTPAQQEMCWKSYGPTLIKMGYSK